MLRYFAGVLSFFYVVSAVAGDMGQNRVAQNEGAPLGAARAINMSELAVGDHWTYEVKDEITGKVTVTRKVIVTDISGGQVATRVDFVQSGR